MNAMSAAMGRGVVWENHCCVDFGQVEAGLEGLARYRRAGVDVVHVNIGAGDETLEDMVRAVAAMRRWLRARPDQYVLALSVADIRRAKAEGRLAVCFDIEGAHGIGARVELVELFYELGVRWMALVYNRRNEIGSGCHDETDEGLTEAGRRLVAEMDRVGMVKDVAHVGYRTAMEVCAGSAVPVTISHSNPRALTDHPRCVPDDLMRECARTGGVLGISGIGIFLGDNDASTTQLVRSVEYAVDVMGVDHVGIGTDFVFMDPAELTRLLRGKPHLWPKGYAYEKPISLAQPEQVPELADALSRRGYSGEALEKILGGNFMRVAAQVWK
jgi:membrane dipeptidase